jgi:Rrf2 family nitric oxide-sensitive transcriptional repressor
MRLTTFTDYTLRTLMYLSLAPGRSATIGEVANAYGISANHMMKVSHLLAQAGDIVTSRGQGGGMRLARRPEDISVGAVARRTEPGLAADTCFCGKAGCVLKGKCVIADALDEAVGAFLLVLDGYTLADLVTPELSRALGIPDLPAVAGR